MIGTGRLLGRSSPYFIFSFSLVGSGLQNTFWERGNSLGICTFAIFFLVSGLAHKKLESHHLILTTNKNLNKLKHQQSWGKLLPLNWKDGQANAENHILPEQEPQQEPVLGRGNLNEELWEAQCRRVWELKTAEGYGCTLLWVLELKNAFLSPTSPHHTTKGDLPEFLYPVHHDQLSTKNYKAY